MVLVRMEEEEKSIDTFLSENAVINYIEKLLVIFLILYKIFFFSFFNVSEIIRSTHSTWGILDVSNNMGGIEIWFSMPIFILIPKNGVIV